MPYCDVLFPISLGPLTYICPEDMAETAEPGMVVAAPLKNRLKIMHSVVTFWTQVENIYFLNYCLLF